MQVWHEKCDMKNLTLGNPDSADIETLRGEIEDLKSQLSEFKLRAETAEGELEKLKSKTDEEANPEVKTEE